MMPNGLQAAEWAGADQVVMRGIKGTTYQYKSG